MVFNISRPNPYTAFNFEVTIGGVLSGGFQECKGLESSVKTTPHQEGGQNAYQHQLIGPTEPAPNIVLKRGLTNGLEMWFWYQIVNQDVVAGLIPFPVRVPLIIFLNDRDGNKVRWWLIRSATPVKWTGPELQAESNSVAFETIELAHHGIFLQGFVPSLSTVTGLF